MKPAAEKRTKRRTGPPMGQAGDKPRSAFGAGLEDLFPPGYGEDLLGGDDNGERKPKR